MAGGDLERLGVGGYVLVRELLDSEDVEHRQLAASELGRCVLEQPELVRSGLGQSQLERRRVDEPELVEPELVRLVLVCGAR